LQVEEEETIFIITRKIVRSNHHDNQNHNHYHNDEIKGQTQDKPSIMNKGKKERKKEKGKELIENDEIQ